MPVTKPRRFKDAIYRQLARVGKAVASPRRLELLDLLAQGPQTVERLGGGNRSVGCQHLPAPPAPPPRPAGGGPQAGPLRDLPPGGRRRGRVLPWLTGLGRVASGGDPPDHQRLSGGSRGPR